MNKGLKQEIEIQLILVKKGIDEVLESCTDPEHAFRNYVKIYSREHQKKFIGNCQHLLDLLKKAGYSLESLQAEKSKGKKPEEQGRHEDGSCRSAP